MAEIVATVSARREQPERGGETAADAAAAASICASLASTRPLDSARSLVDLRNM